MTKPLSIIRADELLRAARTRDEPRPEFIIQQSRAIRVPKLEDHSLVDESEGWDGVE
jgi:hypothetical protein